MRVGIDIDDTLCAFMEGITDFVATKYSITTNYADYADIPLHSIWNVDEERAKEILNDYIYSSINALVPYAGSQACLLKYPHVEFYAITARDYELTDATRT